MILRPYLDWQIDGAAVHLGDCVLLSDLEADPIYRAERAIVYHAAKLCALPGEMPSDWGKVVEFYVETQASTTEGSKFRDALARLSRAVSDLERLKNPRPVLPFGSSQPGIDQSRLTAEELRLAMAPRGDAMEWDRGQKP